MGYILKVRDDKGNVIGIPAIQGKDGIDGIDGIDGKDGIDGVNGKSAYEIACDNGFVGSKEDFLYAIGLRPWSVDENVGSIVSNAEHSVDIEELSRSEMSSDGPWTTVTLDEPLPDEGVYYTAEWRLSKTDLVTFPAINSGDICIKYKYVFRFSNFGRGSIRVNIYKNNTKLHTNVFVDPQSISNWQASGEIITPPLQVNKGDVIRVEIEFKYLFGEDVGVQWFHNIFNDGYSSYIENIDILSNIDTPYKYCSLFNATDISTSEILDALLGV